MSEMGPIEPEEVFESEPVVENVEIGSGVENIESVEIVEEQALNDATHEPEAYIEQTYEVQEAETIEAAFVELVDNTVMNIEADAGEGSEHGSDIAEQPPTGEIDEWESGIQERSLDIWEMDTIDEQEEGDGNNDMPTPHT